MLAGLSPKDIDTMPIQYFGDVLAYWKEDNAANAKLERDRQALRNKPK